MSIISTMEAEGDPIFYEKDFFYYMESYMGYLRKQDNRTISFEPHKSYVFQGDLYGLLKELGIKANMRWLVMRINNLKSPTHVPPNLTMLEIPNEQVIDVLVQKYKLSKKDKT